jgi:preprotein translocase subunit SecB
MTGENKPDLPSSGYSLVKVYTPHLEMSHADSTGVGGQTTVNFGVEWRNASDDQLDVMLKMKIEPSGERPEQIVIQLVGNFKKVGAPTLSMEEFARLQAVAILFPYLRQHVAALTTSSFFGVYYLPIVNVGKLMKSSTSTHAKGLNAPKKSRRRLQRVVAAKKK